mmetsp:Transcript_59981/g.190522  ORF Transcript_59981/g.190522 Transcript_59981/m.190522 type:complete len:221 (+) Transcript_59981:1244-1906(+)
MVALFAASMPSHRGLSTGQAFCVPGLLASRSEQRYRLSAGPGMSEAATPVPPLFLLKASCSAMILTVGRRPTPAVSIRWPLPGTASGSASPSSHAGTSGTDATRFSAPCVTFSSSASPSAATTRPPLGSTAVMATEEAMKTGSCMPSTGTVTSIMSRVPWDEAVKTITASPTMLPASKANATSWGEASRTVTALASVLPPRVGWRVVRRKASVWLPMDVG